MMKIREAYKKIRIRCIVDGYNPKLKIWLNPTSGKFCIRAGDRKEKTKTPIGNFPLTTFWVFKRPKWVWTLEYSFPLLETLQANSTFKHFPVFHAAEGGKTCQERGEGSTRKPLQRCFINPMKQVDGEGLADNLHLANEVCDS